MQFTILAYDGTDSGAPERRLAARQAHLALGEEMLATGMGQGPKDSPAAVAEQGFEALMAGKERAVAGSLSTKLQNRGSRFIPDRIKSKMHRQMAEPKADES